MQYLSFKNFDKLQDNNHKKKMPWFKFYKEFVTDYKTSKLSMSERGVFISLLCITADEGNQVPYDIKWISSRLNCSEKELKTGIDKLIEFEIIIVTGDVVEITKEIDVEVKITPITINYDSQINEIVSYLNEQTGKDYKNNGKDTVQMIIARLKEGYNVSDFKMVIKNRCIKWGNDTKMKEFIRPNTLFRPTNFEQYLVEAKSELNKYKQNKEQESEKYVLPELPPEEMATPEEVKQFFNKLRGTK